MAEEKHVQFKDWSAASDKLDIAQKRYEAAIKTGHHVLLKTIEAKLKEARKTYNDIVARLNA